MPTQGRTDSIAPNVSNFQSQNACRVLTKNIGYIVYVVQYYTTQCTEGLHSSAIVYYNIIEELDNTICGFLAGICQVYNISRQL
jgi:hypothetical protein